MKDYSWEIGMLGGLVGRLPGRIERVSDLRDALNAIADGLNVMLHLSGKDPEVGSDIESYAPVESISAEEIEALLRE